ncbi:hypothetical protein [Bacillus sp. FJAT-45037]|uniref:hypothetical protein n=1 Tax=Bacillus sp. FJAT-45037 TaxID=2011007 RepID=UPI000C23B21B|nr:hypothetical protein [Bacillus sp. FJAT-45037]
MNRKIDYIVAMVYFTCIFIGQLFIYDEKSWISNLLMSLLLTAGFLLLRRLFPYKGKKEGKA